MLRILPGSKRILPRLDNLGGSSLAQTTWVDPPWPRRRGGILPGYVRASGDVEALNVEAPVLSSAPMHVNACKGMRVVEASATEARLLGPPWMLRILPGSKRILPGPGSSLFQTAWEDPRDLRFQGFIVSKFRVSRGHAET